MKIKSLLLLFAFAILPQLCFSQKDDSLRTVVYRLDLGIPKYNSFQVVSGPSHTRLVVHNKRNLSLLLTNGNPYRYTYRINHSYVALFKEGKVPFDTISKVVAKSISETGSTENPEAVIDFAKKLIIQSGDAQLKQESHINEVNANSSIDEQYKLIVAALKSIVIAEEELKGEIESYVSEISSEDHLNKDEFMARRKHFLGWQVKLKKNLSELKSAVTFEFKTNLDDFKDRAKLFDEIAKPVDVEINKMFSLKMDNYMIPINFDGENIDAVELVLEREDKKVTGAPVSVNKYKVWVIGGLKIDISPGVFFTTLKNREYETVSAATDAAPGLKKIYKKETGNLQMAVGSTVNVALRTAGWVRPTFNAGLLLTQDQNIQIIAGAGFHFGKMERLSLVGGIALGNRQELSSRYKTDDSEAYDLGTQTEVPLTTVFKVGGFFGLTYNLGSIKKEKPTLTPTP